MEVYFDTETALIRPGFSSPEIVCSQVCEGSSGDPFLLGWDETEAYFRRRLEEGAHFFGHYVAFDFGVLAANYPRLFPLIWRAYEEGRVHCTKIRAQLLDTAAGQFRGGWVGGEGGKWVSWSYTLDDLNRRYFRERVEKGEDTWRKHYSKLWHVPIADWPEEARKYALNDPVVTRRIAMMQAHHSAYMPDEAFQARRSFALALTSAWGMRTDVRSVATLRAATEAEIGKVQQRLIAGGLAKVERGGRVSRNVKIAQAHFLAEYQRQGKTPRYSEPSKTFPDGQISTDAEACETLGFDEENNPDGDPLITDFGNLTAYGALLSKDCVALERGVTVPVHTRFDFVATGRTSSSKPNLQNWRRIPGVRECFEPRKGFIFLQADYDGLELRTLAEACFQIVGFSRLGEALNAGRDPHLILGAGLVGITYDEAVKRKKEDVVKDARQLAKAGNFGFPGGLGIATFIKFAKAGYGVNLSPDWDPTDGRVSAPRLKEQWAAQWEEMPHYFRYIRDSKNAVDRYDVQHLFTGRLRGNCTYTQACNSRFQGLGADATSQAYWLVMRACYMDQHSPLFGCRVVNFIHDEFILEIPDDEHATARGEELRRLMVAGANVFLPNHPATTSPVLMRYWSKDAHEVFDEAGRLIPWALHSCPCDSCRKKATLRLR